MLLAVAASLASTIPAASDSVTRWRPYTEEAAARCGVPVEWIERVMQAESAGLTRLGGGPITSRAGAMGLMQLMPATWAEMRSRIALGVDPHDPHDNILAGSCYLRMMYDRFGYPGLFAAYNAGPGRYADHLTTGRPLPGETRRYLAKQLGSGTGPMPVGMPPVATVFFSLRAWPQPTTASPPSGICVTRGNVMNPP